MTTKLPPSLIADGSPNKILGTLANNNLTEYDNDLALKSFGCNIVYVNSNTISVTPGIRYNPNNGAIGRLSATITKSINVLWAAGNNQGGMQVAKANNTTYHVFLIANATTFNTDVLISNSLSAPVAPAGWVIVKRVGTIHNTTAIVPFTQCGKKMYFNNTRLTSTWQQVAADNTTYAGTRSFFPPGLPYGTPLTVELMVRAGGVDSNASILQVYELGHLPTVSGQALSLKRPGVIRPDIDTIWTGLVNLVDTGEIRVQYTITTFDTDNYAVFVSTSVLGYTDHLL